MSTHLTPDSLWSGFCDVMFTGFDLYVPCKYVNAASRTSRPVRKYPSHIRKLLSRKRCLWRYCRDHPVDAAAWSKYLSLQSEYRNSLNRHELDIENRILESGDTSKFYKYANKKLSRPSGVGSLQDNNGQMIIDNSSKANLLNEYFSSVSEVDNGTLPRFDRRVSEDVFIDNIEFTPENVIKSLSHLKPISSTGPDGIPPIALKQLRTYLACPLASLFNSFMSVGKLPTDWKKAIITPIYKKGQSSLCNNYRPISLTSTVCKIMERIIVSGMCTYLRHNKLITKEQHGFITKRSTTTNLLETLNDWTLILNNRKFLSAVYIDFSKAFDFVVHSKLYQKFSAYGICGNLLNWIKSFLSDRTHTTRVGHSISDVADIRSGIVQGSCIGPILFILYINDVTSILNNNVRCKIYADDLKLYTEIISDDDCVSLQSTIDELYKWSVLWQLQISVSKCSSMLVRTRNSYSCQYYLNGTVLPDCDSVRDLGVCINSRLKFNEHVINITAKARQRLGILFKCFTTRDPDVLSKAYVTYIRPILEYASPIWNSNSVSMLFNIESVQRFFTRRIIGLKDTPYKERNAILNLDSLELRRLRADLVMAYKIIFGLVDVDCGKFFTLRSSLTRGHAYRINAEKFSIHCRLNFFSVRIANAWNNLPADTVDFSSLVSFKNSINRLDFAQYVSY